MPNNYQRLEPLLDRWVQVDPDTGEVVRTKKTPGPYKGVPEAPRPILTDEEHHAVNPSDAAAAQERVERQDEIQAEYRKSLGYR